uniref:Glutaredoxin domain-containing protein n=1 Tax=Globodera pallida TaxID=36090 RepID=A0A183CN81_GLOPA
MGGSSSVPESIANKVGEAPVVVYTKSGCGYCDLAKELLGREQIRYQEHDLAQKEREDPEEAKVFICGNFIGGYTELAKLRETNLLRDEILRCSDE